MTRLVLHPTAVAHWHALLSEAELAADDWLDEDLESYVVFMLMRFAKKPEIAHHILAKDYLNSRLEPRPRQIETLRDVGDVCLLHAGLFPKRARHRQVSEHYYVDLGSGAYYQLSHYLEHGVSTVYQRLSASFLRIKQILNHIQCHKQNNEEMSLVVPTAAHLN